VKSELETIFLGNNWGHFTHL